MASDEKRKVFDWGLYGALVRKARTDLGYRKAEDFADSIWRRTRVKVSRDTLYKIEQGRQVPDGNQFMAINMALSGTRFFPWITNLCTSMEWQSIEDQSCGGGQGEVTPDKLYLPHDWKTENFDEAIEAHPELEGYDLNSLGEYQSIPFLDEPRWMFEDDRPPF